MGYRMTVHKKDGTVEQSENGKAVKALSPLVEGTSGVVVKDYSKRQVFHNLHPSLSKQVREQEIGDDLRSLRKEYTHSKGMSKKGTMKHVARIPAEIYWSERAERGYDNMRGPKNLKAICDKWNLNVSHW